MKFGKVVLNPSQPLPKKQRIQTIILLFIVGILFTALGIFLLLKNTGIIMPTKDWIKIDATITDVNHTTQKTYVSYIVNQIQYNHIQLNEYSSGDTIGQVIRIAYDPSNPANIVCATTTSYILNWIATVFALLGGGFIPIFFAIKQIRMKPVGEANDALQQVTEADKSKYNRIGK